MTLEDVWRHRDALQGKGIDEYLEKNGANKDIIGLPALDKGKRFHILGLDPFRGYYLDDLAGFGIVPTSQDTFKTFFLPKKSDDLEVWDTHARFDAKKKHWETIADEQNLETIRTSFSEDFYAFIRQDTFYFVTQSGMLFYALPRKEGEKSRKMRPLWYDEKRPITAVIEDADRDKVWLFARRKKDGAKQDVFFEMNETIKPQPFDPAKLRPVAVEGRAKALLEYLPLISGKDKK